MIDAKTYAIKAHKEVNDLYDGYLPYEFHLNMVNNVFNKFSDLLTPPNWYTCGLAVWLHDVIENARKNYSEIERLFGRDCAEVVRAVTNDIRGRNRAERMSDSVYSSIKHNPDATFVKLCDRIANVKYSLLMCDKRKLDMYSGEQAHFKNKLHVEGELEPMWDYLEKLFNEKD